MHVSTHHDRIWQEGCQQKENSIIEYLTAISGSNWLVKLVDSLTQDDVDYKHCGIITDNQILKNIDARVISLLPEFWHIYSITKPAPTAVPMYDFSCLMNRISGERLRMLYKLHELGVLHRGLVSFNCLHHDIDPGLDQRRQNYRTVHAKTALPDSDQSYQTLQGLVPMLLDHDPDTAAMMSKVTVIMESYASHGFIALSEKIFRALQTPRPWLLYCSPGAVDLLRQHNFDVMDDCIDHGYDSIKDHWHRMDALIEQLDQVRFDPDRCNRAVIHNQLVLYQLGKDWPDKLSHACQSILLINQEWSNTV